MKNKAPVLILYDFIFPFSKAKVPLSSNLKKILDQIPKASKGRAGSLKCVGLTKKMERAGNKNLDSEEKFYSLGTLLEVGDGGRESGSIEVAAAECVRLLKCKHVPDPYFSPFKSVVLENFTPNDEFYSKDLFLSKENKLQACFYENFELEETKKLRKPDAESILNELLTLHKLIRSKTGMQSVDPHPLENRAHGSRIKRIDLLRLSYELAFAVNEQVNKDARLLPDWLDYKYEFLRANIPNKVLQLKEVIRRIS